jgi:Ca-activated chloride channel family protein
MRSSHMKSSDPRRIAHPRRGSMIVLSALLLVVVIAFVAFAVDLSFISMTKSQLQNAADSASLATVLALANTPLDDNQREEKARQWDVTYAESNHGHGEVLENADITLGHWDSKTRTFAELAPGGNPNAAQVVVRRSMSGGNEVPLFFAPVMGLSNVDVTATAVATIGEDDPRDIILVIDCSKSMGDHDRMTYTKSAAFALTDELLSSDRLGLAVYSYVKDKKTTTGFLERGLNFDHSLVLGRIPQLEPELYTSKTNIAGGMRVALEEFGTNPHPSGNEATKIMVLMTDGHANAAEAPEKSPNKSIEYYANEASAAGVIIHSVTLGSGADKKTVGEAAEITGGTYHHVDDDDSQTLIEVFKKIGRGNGQARIVQ